MNYLLGQLNAEYMENTFLPLRRLYLRYGFLQIRQVLSARIREGLVELSEAGRMIVQGLKRWTVYCRGLESLILDLYRTMQQSFLERTSYVLRITCDPDMREGLSLRDTQVESLDSLPRLRADMETLHARIYNPMTGFGALYDGWLA